MKVIGFSGKMGSGKSTAIKLMDELRPGRVVNVKFAATLYKIQEKIYDLISPVYRRPKDFVKDRKLLQFIGTDWGRDTISDTLWVDLWEAAVKDVFAHHPDAIVVCDDVRFDNEAQKIKELGGIIVRIASNRDVDTSFGGVASHASESGVTSSLIDYTITNNSTIDRLKAQVDTLLMHEFDLYKKCGKLVKV